MIKNEIYNNWFKKFKNYDIILNLLYIFIGEIKPFSIDPPIARSHDFFP